MSLTKLGNTYFNGEKREVYQLCGTATMDGRRGEGKQPAKVSVAALNLEDGTTLFVNVNGWRDRERDVAAIRKRDTLLAIGTFSSREYNGKKYYDLDADFLIRGGVYGTQTDSFVPAGSGVNVMAASDPVFEEIGDDDGELPF